MSLPVPVPPASGDTNSGPGLLAAEWFIASIFTLFLVARLYTRKFITRDLGWDDFLLVCATVSHSCHHLLFSPILTNRTLDTKLCTYWPSHRCRTPRSCKASILPRSLLYHQCHQISGRRRAFRHCRLYTAQDLRLDIPESDPTAF